MNQSPTPSASALEELPSIDEVLRHEVVQAIRLNAGEKRTIEIVRSTVAKVRREMREASGVATALRSDLTERIVSQIAAHWNDVSARRTRKVINATGVVIHTNLGRAPLSAAAVDAVSREAAGYATVEYDIEAGQRGKRGEYVEKLLCQLTGAESAIVVNNCAAAAYMILSVFAKGRDVVISRGELVEIGGDFRVPDVLTESGATLREVGTTNRTKLRDYANAIGERTAILLRVHPSNYRITGFTEMPQIEDLARLARENKVILYEDSGSGALIDLAAIGLADEPVISESIAAGADLVSFSGDKLLGGPQAGLIVGRRDLIDALRKNPLYRAMRVSKLTYAALEATLDAYARDAALEEIPVQRMLAATEEALETRARHFVKRVISQFGSFQNVLNLEILAGESVVGGGAGPDISGETKLIAISAAKLSSASMERILRKNSPPIISRLQNDRVLLDLRTVNECEEEELIAGLVQLAETAGSS